MSCAYLLVRSCHGIEDARRRIELARGYVPIVPETELAHEILPNVACAVWSTATESARGSYVHTCELGDFVVYNGWVSGFGAPSEPASSTESEDISRHIRAVSFDDFVEKATGEWSVLSVDRHGEIRAATDFLGAEHIYFGMVDGVVVVSNRAILCAVALHGSIPAPNPWIVGWLLTQNRAFVSDDETPFSAVRALHPRSTLTIARDSDAIVLRSRPSARATTSVFSWDQLAGEIAERVRVIERLSSIPFRLSLTGGRDSRLVLAALVAAKCVDRLRGCYLIADANHPDAVVGRMLASHYGLSFECMPRDATTLDLWNDLAVHNFQSEMGVHFWDNKGVASRPREGRIGGMYGEIYWSHAYLQQWLGWSGVARVFENDTVVDPHGIFTSQSRSFYRGELRRYWQRRRDEGLRPTQVRDRWHRDVRMWRWAGQARLAGALGMVNVNPIPSPRLLDRYLALSMLDQRYGRVHFELMKRCDAWLTEQPFGTAGFSFWVSGRRERRMVVPPHERPVAPQRVTWQSHRREIEAYLLAPSRSDFFEIVDKNRFEQRLRSMQTNCSQDDMNAVYGALGVRHALEEPIQALPCRVDVT